MSGHCQIKNTIAVRKLAYVAVAKRQLEIGMAETSACPLEHTRRNIDSIELERVR